jgi:hypothetical protein
MLQTASPAEAKEWTGRYDSFCSRRRYLFTHGFGITTFIGSKPGEDFFAWKRAIDEDNLSFMMSNAPSFVAEFINVQNLGLFW